MQPLPLNEKPYFNTDEIANIAAASEMYDCYLEQVPGVGFVTRRRPGLAEFADTGTGVAGDGIYFWETANKVIVVNNGNVYELLQGGTLTMLGGPKMKVGTPVVFAEGNDLANTSWLYMANGKLLYTTDGVTMVAPTDANTPSATHVAYINSRFIANEPGTNRWDFTDVNPATNMMDNAYWGSTDNPVTCESRGDNLTALYSAWQEIYAWGPQGLQVFQDDGATPFSNVQGAFTEAGIEAPYSLARVDNTLFALCVIDNQRCVVKMSGRSPVVISEPITKPLAAMSSVTDAIGDIISVGGMALYVLSFPSANVTWVYDYKSDTWGKWGLYTGNAETRDRFIGQHSCFVRTWNKHLILSRIDGKIYELSRDYFTDGSHQCMPLRRTGHLNPAGGSRAMCTSLYITGKPGLTSDAKLMMRWRDDGKQQWSNWMELSFEKTMVEPLNRMGIFRTRQYEFKIPDGQDTILIGGSAEFKGIQN